MQTSSLMMPRPSLRAALIAQLRVLHALMMREVITRFGRENLGVLWLVGEPMIFTLGVATLWTLSGLRHTSQMPIVAFAVTGYSSVLMWRNSATRASGAIPANKPLLYHRQVTVLDLLFVRTLLEISGATGSFIVLSCLFVSIGWMPGPQDPLEVVIGWLMLAWFGSSLAIVIGAASNLSEIVERLWHPAAYLLFPLSGAGFMVDWLPPRFQQTVLLLPMVHGVEILREGWFGDVIPTHYNIPYMAACCAILSLAGLMLQRMAGRSVEQH